MRRRDFLTSTAVGAFTLASIPNVWALDKDNPYREAIGLQMYTLRNQLKEDTKATVRAVADAGYYQAEPFGFPDCQPMIEACKEFGLKVKSSHFNWNTVVNPEEKGTPFAAILDVAHDLGLEHLVIPYLADKNRKTLDDYRRVAENCNKAAELAAKAGIQLAYHNHAFEFEPKEGGTTGYDIFRKEFSEHMKFEMDVFWIKVGGVDPVKLLHEMKGRVSQLHLKDLKKGLELPIYGGLQPDAFEELGDGSINMDPIMKAALKVGVKICHVEQDHSPHPLKSIQQSMAHLKTL
jgi:sugar phosphate isomerase/epimerase